ncbi:hypothetical protein HZI73_25265 [Vallitalea pronyensis]|uniref:Uncharacterized protein n=1 Tax=Vallitalea pronyensis TaxID=1348613 RepID=A0A8J8MPT3_9FIRM|nr:hypothetical protein [Vallitalea pronyensis]QUI25404.1 hypothetical protein HZI73_25265 [Vallitalea pronyensis]
MSKRTIQRRLKEEDTTFNEQLNHVKELMVRNYFYIENIIFITEVNKKLITLRYKW